MNRRTKALLVTIPVALAPAFSAACGSRSSTLDDGIDRVIIVQGGDRKPRDSGTVPPSPLDAGSAADAAPKPCHLVQTGAAARTIEFDETTYSFRQNGALARTDVPGRVIQFGNVLGMRTGGWDDPPIYAVELDTTAWPPAVVHAPTQLFHSMHDPADMLELPQGKLGLAWWFDNDGVGPSGIKFRTLDRGTWAPGPDRFLVERGTRWTRPVVSSNGLMVAAYHDSDPRDAGWIFSGFLGVWSPDGTPVAGAVPLWTTGTARGYGTPTPSESVVRTASDVLVASASSACEGISGIGCVPNGIGIFRAADVGPQMRVELVAQVAARDPYRTPSGVRLIGTTDDPTWLSWWELEKPQDGSTGTGEGYLYGMPLTSDGQPAGPVEIWYVAQTRNLTDFVDARGPLTGPLGTFTIVDLAVPGEEAGSTTREIHLVHRQRDALLPIEDLVVTTRATSFPAAVVQLPASRSVILAYSSYPPDNYRGYGEMIRYGCKEDAP